LVARFVRDEEGAGSNPVTPTSVHAGRGIFRATGRCLYYLAHLRRCVPRQCACLAATLVSGCRRRTPARHRQTPSGAHSGKECKAAPIAGPVLVRKALSPLDCELSNCVRAWVASGNSAIRLLGSTFCTCGSSPCPNVMSPRREVSRLLMPAAACGSGAGPRSVTAWTALCPLAMPSVSRRTARAFADGPSVTPAIFGVSLCCLNEISGASAVQNRPA